jgi:hypothetical protein
MRLSPAILEGAENALVERFGERLWRSDLHRLRGVLLADMDAGETQIETAFSEAIRAATEQKSVSLRKRAEATYTEYRRLKRSALGDGERLAVSRSQSR